MTLTDLFRDVPSAEIVGDAGVSVDDLAYDSRRVSHGSLFFCVPGARADGHVYAADAAEAGAAALAVERWVDAALPQVRVSSVRAAMGPVSAAFFGHPSRAMRLAGVTGTNGKTTTCFMLEKAFASLGLKTGIIGTVLASIAGEAFPAVRTTPEAPDLQRLLARMRAAGVGGAAVEVSSEGLALLRPDGTSFAVAIFTNLSQDHLNFHIDMERYFQAKARLFAPGFAGAAVINTDDEHGRRLIKQCDLPVTTFSMRGEADVQAHGVRLGRNGSSFTVECDGNRFDSRVRIPGHYNVANALSAIAAFRAMKLPIEAAVRGAGALEGVPGRMEPISVGQEFTVLVDYAHTPDSLENVLRATRDVTPPGGRLVCVFGCGGDRDRTKRPQMGRVAVERADRVIVTSDNPRSEDPRAIIAEIEAGAAQAGGSYEVEPDRREAIRMAIEGAQPHDVVVIAGKGHETGQEVAGRVIPFDDRIVAREILEARR